MVSSNTFNFLTRIYFSRLRFMHRISIIKRCLFNHSLNKSCQALNQSPLCFIPTGQRIFRKLQDILPSTLYCLSSPQYTTVEEGAINKLTEKDLAAIIGAIKEEFTTNQPELRTIAEYNFDGQGKAFRPLTVLLMARACNIHNNRKERLLSSQYKIAMISEMIHIASLIHDDVIDGADIRRGKPSINLLWGQRKAIFAGDYIISVTSRLLSQLGHDEVVIVLAQVIEDLVKGEFMQLGSKMDENERFAHYLRKTFKKTASLIASSCKAVAIFSQCKEEVLNIAYEYGRNIGIAFQLIDDMLDFISSQDVMGKPTAIDLKLGLATAPVLFACQKYPELNSLIMRRFSEHGDIEMAWDCVQKSNGLEQTRYLAQQHCNEAVRQIKLLNPSAEQEALILLTDKVLARLK